MRANTRASAALSLADEANYRGHIGQLAAAAIGNSTFVETASPSAGQTGTIVSTTFTPKASAKLLVIGDVSGVCDTGARTATFTLTIGGVSFTVVTGPGGNGAHGLSVCLPRIFTPGGSLLVVGTASTITWTWGTDAGTFQPGSGQGGVTIVELL